MTVLRRAVAKSWEKIIQLPGWMKTKATVSSARNSATMCDRWTRTSVVNTSSKPSNGQPETQNAENCRSRNQPGSFAALPYEAPQVKWRRNGHLKGYALFRVAHPPPRFRVNQLFSWMDEPTVKYDQRRVQAAKRVSTRDVFSANIGESLPPEKLRLPNGNVTHREAKSVPNTARLAKVVSPTH